MNCQKTQIILVVILTEDQFLSAKTPWKYI